MKKLLIILAFCAFCFGENLSLSSFFVNISDALSEAKNENLLASKEVLKSFKSSFDELKQSTSPKGMEVKTALETALNDTNVKNIEELSSALIAFEKEQNPVDYEAKKRVFEKRIMPLLKNFMALNKEGDIEKIAPAYKKLYDTWQRNERVVGELSMAHYAGIERALGLYRVAMVSNTPNKAMMDTQIAELEKMLKSFIKGEQIEANNDEITLSAGLALLKNAKQKFASDEEGAKALIIDFIGKWPSFEGEVRIANASLYNEIESTLPLIAGLAWSEQNSAKLDKIITDIEGLNLNASYSAFDSGMVLFREGLEALLIIVALLSALSFNAKARKFIIAGSAFGLFASVGTAFALSSLLPNADTNREILEGIVGIVAVAVMVFIIAWMHSKSSQQNWQAFIERQKNKILASGSIAGLGGLAFLAVYREGAETILFYTAMLPKMKVFDFIFGIGIASALLLAIALFMRYATLRLPMHRVFGAMGVLIYFIGFKMLGVSIHALQLTSVLPTSIVSVPSISELGIFGNAQCLLAQGIYVVVVIALAMHLKQKESKLALSVARA